MIHPKSIWINSTKYLSKNNYISLLLLMLLMNFKTSSAQNHVPNPSFEDKISCPSLYASVTTHCKEWYSPTFVTPDFFDTCTYLASSVDVPNTGRGYQQAIGGGFVGLYTYWKKVNHFNEYVATKIMPLDIDSFYEVSISINLANIVSGYASDGIGVFFYENGIDTYQNGIVPHTPQVNYDRYSFVTDTLKWTRLKGYLLADSSYDHIIIGCFKDSFTINTIQVKQNPTSHASYYFIDSVVVKKVPNINIEYTDSLLCAGDTIQVGCFVNPVYFNANNTFSLQLSDANGSFNNPMIIGTLNSSQSDTIQGVIPVNLPQGNSYRIRIVGNSPVYTSFDNDYSIRIGPSKPAKPTVTANTPVCDTDTLKLTANSTTLGVDWYWETPLRVLTYTKQNSYNSIAHINDTAWYRVYASNGGCLSEPDSFFMSVDPYLKPGASVSITPGLIVNPYTTITFTAQTAQVGITPQYQWYKNNTQLSGETNKSYLAVMNVDMNLGDSICVTVKNSYHCPLADTVYKCSKDITLSGIEENLSVLSSIEIAPNPNNGRFSIQSTTNITDITILDITGRIVYRPQVNGTRKHSTIDISSFTSGTYILRLTDTHGKRFFKKVVIK